MSSTPQIISMTAPNIIRPPAHCCFAVSGRAAGVAVMAHLLVCVVADTTTGTAQDRFVGVELLLPIQFAHVKRPCRLTPSG
jgi:hypothetical protein